MENKILELLSEICETDEIMEDKESELFESGIMDSMAFAEFLVAVEEELDVVIAPSEVEREDIDTPVKIISLIMSRM